MNAVRFVESIHGRAYVIDVTLVARDRWRARLGGGPGATTALMPFYGASPEEAAEKLVRWLTRARAASAKTAS